MLIRNVCAHAGEVYGRYVPQSVQAKDGSPLDVDIVVNELFRDGDEVFVEYSNGPQPYRVRWVKGCDHMGRLGTGICRVILACGTWHTQAS